MEITSKTKKIMRITLIIVALGIILSFAVFSVNLIISSSAKMNSDSKKLLLKIYGFMGEDEADIYNLNKYTSETNTNIFELVNEKLIYSTTGLINNDKLSLNIGTINLHNPGDSKITYVRITNEGKYDTYFDTSQLNNNLPATCKANPGTTKTLVDETCSHIKLVITSMYKEESLIATKNYVDNKITIEELNQMTSQDCFFHRTGICKLEKGKSVFISAYVTYSNEKDVPLTDSEFSVTFPDLELKFTSNNPNSTKNNK